MAITTYQDFHNIIAKNSSLVNLFDKVEVSEVSADETMVLLQILFLQTGITLSGLVVFPFSGRDTWHHLFNTELVINSQTLVSVPPPYQNYPLYPSVLAALSQLAGVPPATVGRPAASNCLTSARCSAAYNRTEACPQERTNRSRAGQAGWAGS